MFTVPKLHYKYSDLEPYIDSQTMEIHHSKHHQSYVDNLNKALEGRSEFEGIALEELLKKIDSLPTDLRQTVTNHGGGHANHSFYWKIMSPIKSEPEGVLKETLEKQFGSFDSFKEKFTEKAMNVFGSGWAFLVLTRDNKLQLKRHSFQNSPISHGNIPILGIDVWEHAYYLKYQNKRMDYIKAWWQIVNWVQAEKKL